MNKTLSESRITEIALANGFKLKEQPGGEMALNPYVFGFVDAILAAHSNHHEGQSGADAGAKIYTDPAAMRQAFEDEYICYEFPSANLRDGALNQFCAGYRAGFKARPAAPAASAPVQHDSDCSTHNMPAYPAGPCDCSVAADSAPTEAEALRAVLAVKQAELDDWIHTNKIDELQREVLALRSASAPICDMQAGEREVLCDLLPVTPAIRARTLLAHLWRRYDAAGTSMGRSHEAVVLEAVMGLLGEPDQGDMLRLEKDSGSLVGETREYLSTVRAANLGFADARAALTTSTQPAADLPSPELTWLFTHCRAIGMDCKSDSGKWEHDIALFTINLQDKIASLTTQPAPASEVVRVKEIASTAIRKLNEACAWSFSQNGLDKTPDGLLTDVADRVRWLERIALTAAAQPATQAPSTQQSAEAVYTCKGKGGEYSHVGVAAGAGPTRGNLVHIYRDTSTGNLFYRTPMDFADRMELVSSAAARPALTQQDVADSLVPNQPLTEVSKQRLLNGDPVTINLVELTSIVNSARGTSTAPVLTDEQELDALPAAARDILAERQRQISAEGWTPEHDDAHGNGELASAAVCYAMESDRLAVEPMALWPWDISWWKPKDRRRNLVKASALILAEIERIDRAAIAHSTAARE